jgi:hypothetical protein
MQVQAAVVLQALDHIAVLLADMVPTLTIATQAVTAALDQAAQ